MAFSHGTAARMWLDGFPSACYLNEFSLDGEVDTAETTTLCKSAKTYIPGLEDATVSLSGFFDTNTLDPASTFEALLDARKRAVFPVIYYPEGGDTIGDPAYLLNGFLTSYNVGTTVDDAATLEMEYQSSTGFQRGVTLEPPTTETATGDSGTWHDNLVATTQGGAALLSVESVTGTTPTMTVTVQHTDDDPTGTPTWVTLATFPVQNAQNGVYVTFTGTVERYTRVIWTIAGTTPQFVFNVAISRN